MGNSLTALGVPEVIEGLVCCTTSTFTVLFSSCSTRYPRFLFSLFLVFGTVLSFLSITPNMRSQLDKLPYFCTTITTDEICDNLLGYGAVYRICLSLAAFYGVFALLMLNTTSAKDCRLKFHNGFWFLKLVLLVAILVVAFHIPRHTEFGRIMMYGGLTAGFIFIMIQILLVIDFAYSWSASWREKTDSGHKYFWNFALIFSTILVYSMAITMTVFFYLYFIQWQDLSKCQGNMFLISFSVLQCLIASVISVLPQVRDTNPGSGLLQSSIVSLYTMYLTWCTLSSEPDGSCNPMGDVILEYDKVSGVNGQAVFDCVLMSALLIFACNVRPSTSRLEKIGFSLSKYSARDGGSLNYQDVEKYSDDEENIELEYNYSFFHFVMFLASLQLMMVVTNWHGPDELAEMKKLVKNWATVWIQLTSSFLCVLFYIWATVTPLLVRTWGPCFGLDYESVPTEDDDERLRRRREISRQRKPFKCKKIENNFKKECGKFEMASNVEELGKNSVEKCLKNANLSNDLGIEHDFNLSEQASRPTLENLPLSSVRAQKDRVGQITDDSGLCDTANITTQSRTVSKENLHSNKSANNDELSLGATGNRENPAFSNGTIHEKKTNCKQDNELDKNHTILSPEYNLSNEKQRRTRALEKENISAHTLDNYGSDSSSSPKKAENLNLTSKSSTAIGKFDQSHLNKYTLFEREQKRNLRPHSSMAFTNNRTLTQNTRIPMHNSSTTKNAPKRPYSSMALRDKNIRPATNNSGLEERSLHSPTDFNEKLTDSEKAMMHDSPSKTKNAFKKRQINELSIANKVLPKRPYSSIDFTNCTFEEKCKNSTPNRRPHSSMAFVAHKTISIEGKEDNFPKGNKALARRPASCAPLLTKQRNTTLLRKEKGCQRSLSLEEDSSGENKDLPSMKQYVSRNISAQIENLQENFADENCESLDGSGFKSKETELEGHSNGSGETLFEMDEAMRSQEYINKAGLKLNIEKTAPDMISGKSTATSLNMKDHLKWVKSLRRNRESMVFLKKPRTSENSKMPEKINNGSDLSVSSTKKRKQGMGLNVLLDTESICETNLMETKETLKGGKNRKIAKVNMSKNFESNETDSHDKKIDTKTSTSREKISQNTSTYDEITQGKESNHEGLQITGCENNIPQTCNAAQEILRLQEKILKFQAKVVKTQKKIFEMQQEGEL